MRAGFAGGDPGAEAAAAGSLLAGDGSEPIRAASSGRCGATCTSDDPEISKAGWGHRGLGMVCPACTDADNQEWQE